MPEAVRLPPRAAVATAAVAGVWLVCWVVYGRARPAIAEAVLVPYTALLLLGPVGVYGLARRAGTAGPIALVLWLWMLLLRPDRVRGSAAARVLMPFGLAIAVFGAFWYLRNWFATGNPLFPAEVAVFSGRTLLPIYEKYRLRAERPRRRH